MYLTGLIFFLAGLLTSDAELTKEQEAVVLELYDKQLCLLETFLDYWKDMVKGYKLESDSNNPQDDSDIQGFRQTSATVTSFFSLVNERTLSIDLNITAWVCYIFYKEVADPPEMEKAEKCKQFARFLSWYTNLFSVKSAFEECNKPGSTFSNDDNTYIYRTEELVSQMEKILHNLNRMNTKLLNGDDDTNVFEKLREETEYYLSEQDVMPIRELLEYGNPEEANAVKSNIFTAPFTTLISVFRPSQTSQTPQTRDPNYENDYYQEIFRRLQLFFGHRRLMLNHFFRAYLGTTKMRTIFYIDDLITSINLVKMYWERIIAIEDMPSQQNLNVVEKAILFHKEFFDVFLTYLKMEVPKNEKRRSCDSEDQNSYVQYILKLN